MISNFIEFTVNNLEEFFEKVTLIGGICSDSKNSPNFSPLWFRGLKYCEYNLLPSMFRKRFVLPNSTQRYSSMHLGEDYRYQSFKSRAYHHINSRPESRIEWQEIMQHHFIKTRLMDWSESAVSALLFALEPFIDPNDDPNLRYNRKCITPTVWVLRPYMLNKIVYDTIADNSDGFSFISNALNDMPLSGVRLKKFVNKVGRELSANKNKYFSYSSKPVIDGLIGLSVIDSYRQQNMSRLNSMLLNFEFNPFFYILARYYSDGICTAASRDSILPPLAVIHPYHSDRIKAQHGAFTIFPYYCSCEEDSIKIEDYYAMGYDIRAMDCQEKIKGCLFKIRICNGEQVAKELLSIGEKHTSLYPELQKYAEDIEATDYHV